MSFVQKRPRVYLTCAPGDHRLYEQLARHLAATSRCGNWEIASRRSIAAGLSVGEHVRQALLHADVIVLLATARYFQDIEARAEMDISLGRFAAGEAHLLVLHAADCLLDPRLASVPVVSPEGFSARNRDQFWRTCAARISVLCETMPFGRPRYEDEDNRAAGEALRAAWWSQACSESPDLSQLRPHQMKLRQDGRLRAGDIVGRRFHVRKRIQVAPEAVWAGYDFAEERQVEIRVLPAADVPRWAQDGGAVLQGLVTLQHDGLVRVLTTLREEERLDGAYFVVERFPGAPLRNVLLDERTQGSLNLAALAPVADAIAAMHGRGVSHGAIGLETLRVVTGDDRPVCKLAWDFGACAVSPSVHVPLPSAKADTAALAGVILSCLHGALLPADTTAVQLRRILQMAEAQPDLKALIARNLAPDSARPEDASRLADLLQATPRSHFDTAAGWFDLEMRPVTGGLMRLGAHPEDTRAWPSELPSRSVIVQGFALSVYPVTQRLYSLVMGANPSAYADACAPVHNVSFLDALSFCNQLSVQRGLEPVYIFEGGRVVWRKDADGYRLPTEAEWEHAAKGDRDALHPWGHEAPADQVCWNGPGNALGWRGRKSPSPVWNHPEGATLTGFFDMVGNVWEWCWDWFASFAEWSVNEDEPIIEPIGAVASRPPPVPRRVADGAYRVLRGGAWNLEDPVALRTTVRSTDLETVRDPDIGFRVARGAKPLAREIPLRADAPAQLPMTKEAART